jgi:TonB family protein
VIVAALLLAAEEEQAIVARILDSSSERVPRLTVAPVYPRKARRDRIEGEVQVCFDIDRDGRTHRISVRNSTNRAFERPSIAAVRASSFRPLKKEEALVAIKFCRTFIFALEPR